MTGIAIIWASPLRREQQVRISEASYNLVLLPPVRLNRPVFETVK